MWSRRHVLFSLAILTIGVLFAGFCSPKHALATTGVNQEISFEGKIVTSAGLNIPDGTYNMEFVIYTGCTNNTGTGCTAAWTEDYLVSASQGVQFTSGTFQVNLDSINQNNFSGINFNTYPLYLSIQIGSTSSCTPAGNFTTNCGGDGVMSPYILFTSTPYSLNSNELGGLTASQFGQLATSQTWTGANTFQPSTNITPLTVIQDSGASPSADIFDVQTANTTDAIQVAGPSANNANVTINTVGSGNTLSLGTANLSETVDIGDTTLSTGTQTINVGNSSTSGGTTNINIGNTNAGTVTIQSNGTINVGHNSLAQTLNIGNTTGGTTVTINAGTGGLNLGGGAVANTIQIGNTTGAVAQTVDIGNNATSSSTSTVNIGSTIGSSTTTLNSGTGNITLDTNGSLAGTIVDTTVDSGSAFQVQNAEDDDIISVGTTAANSLIANQGFEVNATGWSVYNSATSATRDIQSGTLPIAAYNGVGALKVVTTSGNTNQGTEYALGAALTTSTTYYLSFEALIGSGTFTDIAAAYSYDGTIGHEVACGSYNTQTVVIGGWTRITCSFATSSTTGNSSAYLAIRDTAATAHTFWIDAVQLQTTQITPYSGGINDPLVLQNNSNSTTAFQIANAVGTDLLDVDTTNAGVIIDNSGLAGTVQIGNTTGAVAQTLDIGNNATTSSTSTVNIGSGIGSSTTTINAGTGGLNLGNSGIANTIQIGNTTGAVAQTVDIGNNTTASSTSTVSIGSAIGSSTTTINAGTGGLNLGNNGIANTIQIGNTTGAVAQTIAIGTNSTGSSTSTVNIGSTIGSSQVQIEAGSGNIGLSSAEVIIGNGTTGSSTPDIVVLNSGTSSSDPTEVNGAMYYNSNTGNFRCGEAGTWENCLGGLLSSANEALTNDISASSGNTQFTTPEYTMPANYCVSGRVVHFYMAGQLTTGTSTTATFQFIPYLSVSGTPVKLLNGPGLSTITASISNGAWSLDGYFICTAAPGSSEVVVSSYDYNLPSSASAITSQTVYGSTSGSGNSFATNGALVFQLDLDWGGSGFTGTSIALTQFVVQGY